jgi:hypothetical protein
MRKREREKKILIKSISLELVNQQKSGMRKGGVSSI